MRRTAFVLAILGGLSSTAAADGSIVERPLGSTDAPWGYLEYLPPGYDASAANARFPVVVFLSGLGELGNGTTDLPVIANHGPLKLIQNGSTYFADQGAIVIGPQAPDQWMFAEQQIAMREFFDYLAATYKIDPARVYLTGLSSGGGGVYQFLGEGDVDHVVTAAIPICGNQDAYPSMVAYAAAGGTPMWSFQSWGDATNPRARPIGWTTGIARIREANDALDVMVGYPHTGDTSTPAATTQTAVLDGGAFTWSEGRHAGGDSSLRLTLYPGSSHDAWTETYADTAVWDWLLAHGAPTVAPGDPDANPGAGRDAMGDAPADDIGGGCCSADGADRRPTAVFGLGLVALALRRRRRGSRGV
jgi:MYXO-CTERM domain-containing protein